MDTRQRTTNSLSLNHHLTKTLLRRSLASRYGNPGPITKMTNDEYHFMTDRSWDSKDEAVFFKAGETCYAEGWIDNFGLITPKGRKAIGDFENDV